MFFWNSLAFSVIQQILAIWSVVPLLLLFVEFFKVILTSVRWYLIVLIVLICISLRINGVEHLFMCPLVICIFSLEEYHLELLPLFYWVIWGVLFLVLVAVVIMVELYKLFVRFWKLTPRWSHNLQTYSFIMSVVFFCLLASFAMQKF